MKLVELHVLQTVAPCNLNRDDTHSPKDAVFGGVRRARISSQAQKRAIREFFREHVLPTGVLSEEDLAQRTARLVEELVRRLATYGRTEGEARAAAITALNSLKKKDKPLIDEEGKTTYLFFLGRQEIERLADFIHRSFDALQDTKGKKRGKTGNDLLQAIKMVFDGGKAVDLALFGRMLADRPELGVDAAVQVAHAISTHRVDREFDYYTAVDDLNPREETGAGMMGDVEFYSATLYRYAVLDVEKLHQNLQSDRDLAKRGALAFLRAFTLTLPGGKQNSFAAHNPPLFVGLRAGEGMPRNLATAFERPVRASDAKGLAAVSVERLLVECERFDLAFGSLDSERVGLLNLTDGEISYHRGKTLDRFDDLVALAEDALEAMLPKEA